LPRDGLAVLAGGDLAVYPPRGQYQLVVKRLLPQGMGALQLAFLQLKEKLEKEGLFDRERKRPIPMLPRRIGIVTSPSGAAIRDILKQIKKRCAEVDVFIYPAKVQGEGAAAEIVEGIHALNEFGVDVMIVGRGGGSIEDLWPFNEEIVARAIYASEAPVISAVGHEVDVTISDLVADVRALTPTAAGEMVVPDCTDLARQLSRRQDRLRNALVNRVNMARAQLNALAQAAVLRKPMELIRMHQQTIDAHQEHLRRISTQWLAMLHEKVRSTAGRLDSLSPLKVLARGYSITMKADGSVARKASELTTGDKLKTRLHEGVVISTVEGTEDTAGKRQ